MDHSPGEPYRRGDAEPLEPGGDWGFPRSDVVADLTRQAQEGMAFDRLVDETCRALSDLLAVDRVGVFRLRPERRDLLLEAGTGWPDGALGSATISEESEAPTMYTVGRWEPTVVQDIREDERFRRPRLLEEAGVVSGITVVIPAPVNPWGALGVHSCEPQAFDEPDTTFVQAMGQVLSQSISRQRIEREKERYHESNRRLERFAYTVSHDLQEPLRTVSNYLQLIEGRYGDRLEPEGRELFDHAVDGAHRMRRMVQGLLRYSRVAAEGEHLRPVDSQAVCRDALDDLELRIEETEAEVSVGELPTIQAAPDQLAQLFRNLLVNALAYSGDDPPRIHVSAEPAGRVWRFSVVDQGPGIAPEDAGRIFEVFERGDEGVGGLGIGLAICDQIVERHGGRIGVDSQPGEGSRFHFTMPAAELGEEE